MNRDLGLQTATRLAQEWSGPRAAGQLTPEALEALTARFGSLEPLAQARVLLSGCFMRPDRLESCREGLKGLAQAARLDDDEWVQVIGRAVGDYSGTLDLGAVTAESSLVAGTVSDLTKLLDEHPPCQAFRPLEELYLSHRAAAARGGGRTGPTHSHFKLRNPRPADVGVAPGAAAATVADPIDLTALNIPTNQAGYSQKLGTSQKAAVSSALASSYAQQSGVQAAPLPAVAPASADIFLPTRPSHGRTAASNVTDRSRAAGSGRQARTKQLDVHEVKAMRQKEADEARAAAAAAAAEAAACKPAAASASGPDESTAEAPTAMGDVADWEAELEAHFEEPGAKSGKTDETEAEDKAPPKPKISLDAYLAGDKAKPRPRPAPQPSRGRPEHYQHEAHDGEWHQPEEEWQQGHDGHYATAAGYHHAGEWHQHEQGWDGAAGHQHAEDYHDYGEHGNGDDAHYGGRQTAEEGSGGGGGAEWVDHDAAPDARLGPGHADASAGRQHDWDELEPVQQRHPPQHWREGQHRQGGPDGGAEGPPSSPESGEVAEEEGELPPDSPAQLPAKRQRIDDGQEADSRDT
mmetsp:Transcript_15856/g.47713  ORF Transcript_15856/g.47713 Transcript_15856/m.47713 type:complete len:578 (+) Transcript_15856:403-2136(+)